MSSVATLFLLPPSPSPLGRAMVSTVADPDAARGRAGAAGVARSARSEQLTELALQAATGDGAAARAVVQGLAPHVLAACRRMLGATHPDVDDAAQESLIAVMRGLGSFRGESSIVHYACRIAARTCLRMRRRSSRRAEREDAMGRASEPPPPSSPAEVTLSARRRAALRELLDALPPEQAEALALRVVLGLSLDDVAAATSAPINTVRSRVRLAKQAMRRRIEKNPRWEELWPTSS